MTWAHIYTQMIPRSVVCVRRQRPHSCSIVCRNAWLTLPLGCAPIGCNWTPLKLKSSGAHRLCVNTRFHKVRWYLALRSSACCLRPGNLPIFWSDDADARCKDCFELFCGVQTALQHPVVCVRSSLAVTCRGIGADEARLWQRHVGRTACHSAWQAAVGAECSCATNLPTLEVRSRVTVAQGTALAASAQAHHLPVGSSCLPMSAQHDATLPYRRAPTGEQRWLPAASMLVVVGHARCSRTEHVTIGGQFNCSSCVKQFTNSSAVLWVTGHVLMLPENWTVRAFLQLTPRLSNDFTSAWLTFTFPLLFAVAATLKSIDYHILLLSHGLQCSPTLNRQPYEGRLPLTSWWRKSSNMTVGQSSLISLTHHCYDCHRGSYCGWICNQLTSKVDGGITGSRLRWSILT